MEVPLSGPYSCWWQFTAGAEDRTGRILPDNSADVIVADDGRSWCVGPAQHADLAPVAAGTRLRGLRLRPGHVGAVLGVPAHEVTDREVDLDDLFGTSVARRLTAAVWSGAGACAPGLLPARTPRARQLIGALLSSQPVTAGALAYDHGLSDRHLRRLVRDDAGLAPKTLQRVARLHRFLAAVEGRGLGLAAAAAAAGYADQPHLSRDVRQLAGLPPAALLRERAAGTGAGPQA